MPYQNPGDYLTTNNRYAQMLMQGPNYNQGTHAGGLASILQQGAAGFFMGQDRRDKRLTTQALTQGMERGTGTPWVNPDTGEISQHPAITEATRNLMGLDAGNEDAARSLKALLMSTIGQQREAAGVRSTRAYETELLGASQEREDARRVEERRQKTSDLGVKFNRDKILKQMAIDAKSLTNRPTVMVGGQPYYTDDRAGPVFPDYEDPFLKAIGAPPGQDLGGGGSGADIFDGGAMTGGQGVDILGGQAAGDILTGPTKQPTIREIFYGLPPEIQAGILAAPDKQKAFSEYLMKQKTEEGLSLKELNKVAMAQQSRFTKDSGTFMKVTDAYGRIIKSARDPDPAGDLSMVFNYMKMLDPGSVVRESEFRTAAGIGGYGEQFQVWVQKATSGEGLTPKQRGWFEKRAGILFYEQRRKHTKLRSEYTRLSKEYGVKPGKVIVDYYGDFITRADFDQTAKENNMSLDAVFDAMGKKFDVKPDYMRAIYEGTD